MLQIDGDIILKDSFYHAYVFSLPFGIVIPNHNKMNIYSHGKKLIYRDLNVKTPTNFSIVSKRTILMNLELLEFSILISRFNLNKIRLLTYYFVI